MAWPEPVERTAKILFEDHHGELIAIARALRKRKRLSETLRTTDLVNEAFLKIRMSEKWNDDQHFLCSVALSMRNIAFDHIRKNNAEKRWGQKHRVSSDKLDFEISQSAEIDSNFEVTQLLHSLSLKNPRQAQIIDCRFFAGYTNQETANLLNINEKTVRREWNKAKAWCHLKLSNG